MVAEVSAAVPAARRSRNSDFRIASRNMSRSSEMCISQGLFLFAALGSMRRFSGGLARMPPSTTLYLHLYLRADYPRDACDIVDAVRDAAPGHHRVLEGDHDDLRLLRPLLEETGEALRVRLVKVLVDLVEEVERVGVDLLYREDQGDGRDRLFPARHRGRLPRGLSPEARHHVYPAREYLVLVLELEPGLPVGECLEGLRELAVDGLEGAREDLALLSVYALDEPDDGVPLLLELVYPLGQVPVAVVDHPAVPLGALVHGPGQPFVLELHLGEEMVAAVEDLDDLLVPVEPEATELLGDLVLQGYRALLEGEYLLLGVEAGALRGGGLLP